MASDESKGFGLDPTRGNHVFSLLQGDYPKNPVMGRGLCVMEFVVCEGQCQTSQPEQEKDAFGVEHPNPWNLGGYFWPLLQACTGFSHGIRDGTTGNGLRFHP